MGIWLYQMNADEWSPLKFRKSVCEGNILDWSVGKVYRHRHKQIAPGDKVILFFCESKNDEPGIYGFGEIKRFGLVKSLRRIQIAVKPPTYTMMASPIWDEEVRSVIIAIRGNPPRGTMWSVTPGQYKKLRDKMMPKSIPDSIEKKIKASLKKLGAKSSGLNAAVCTHRVMRKMGLLGKKLGFAVHGIGDNSQWLYDQCWTDEDEIGIIQKLPLAMECEWSCGGILGDFQKLVVSRADHRFLVCSHGSPEAWRDCVNDLVEPGTPLSGNQEWRSLSFRALGLLWLGV